MPAPFAFLPPRTAGRVLAVDAAVTLVIGLFLVLVGLPMTSGGGAGIVDFELARTPAEVLAIFARWGPSGIDAARTQTYAGLDRATGG